MSFQPANMAWNMHYYYYLSDTKLAIQLHRGTMGRYLIREFALLLSILLVCACPTACYAAEDPQRQVAVLPGAPIPSSAVLPQPTTEADFQATSLEGSEFVLGPGDTLKVTIWGYPELSEQTTILPDGTVSYPLVGVTRAAGLTAKGFSEELGSALAPHLVGVPKVSVAISEMRSRRFSVMGDVAKAGAFPLWGDDVTVLEAVAQAGGMGTRALPAEVKIFRTNSEGVRESIPVDLTALLTQPDAARADLRLQPGDVVYVPSQDTQRKVCVLGEVNSPGLYGLTPEMTVVEALTAAGWAKPSGVTTSVMVARRTSDGAKEFHRVNVERVVRQQDWAQDLVLAPGDIVYVPEHFISVVADFVNFFSTRVETAAHAYLRVYDATNPASYVVDR